MIYFIANSSAYRGLWLRGCQHVNIQVFQIQRIAAFIGIVLVVAIATRVIGFLIKKFMSALVLGWVDHIAGMAGGAVVATAIVGTIFYVAGGLSFAANNPAFAASKLAPEVTRVSLFSSATPWCSVPNCRVQLPAALRV